MAKATVRINFDERKLVVSYDPHLLNVRDEFWDGEMIFEANAEVEVMEFEFSEFGGFPQSVPAVPGK